MLAGSLYGSQQNNMIVRQDGSLYKTRITTKSTLNYPTWISYFFSFFLSDFKKKIKNEPIADRYVSVEPAKQCKIHCLFRGRRQPSLLFSGLHTTFSPKTLLASRVEGALTSVGYIQECWLHTTDKKLMDDKKKSKWTKKRCNGKKNLNTISLKSYR